MTAPLVLPGPDLIHAAIALLWQAQVDAADEERAS